MASPSPSLPYLELNEQAEQTVLFVHGAFGNKHDWDSVTPHLSHYHLLIPDLPGHGEACENKPFAIPHAAKLLRDLIIQRAHKQVAHVVGHSLGAQAAMDLVSRYPSAVADSSVLVSGFGVSSPSRVSRYVPYAVWVMQRVEWAIPRPLIRWLLDGTDLRRPDLSLCTLELCRQIFDPTNGDTTSSRYDMKWPQAWPARTLIIAAGKSGILPTNDDLDQAQKLARIGQQMNSATTAVTHPELRHPWPIQAPELFAITAKAWFEGRQLPHGFILL